MAPRPSSAAALSAAAGCGRLLLLSGPAAWFVLIYLRALVDPVRLGVLARRRVHRRRSSTTGTSTTSRRSSTSPTYRTIALRTIGIAAAVTVTDALLALPFAYFAARLAPKRLQTRAVRDRAGPAVDELPRARLRVAADPRQGRDPQLDAGPARARLASNVALLELGDVDRLQLHLAAVHDPAGLARVRARARLVPRGVGRPRRARLDDVPPRAAPAGACRASSPARSSRSR